jgi:hypothetical protein
VSPDKIKPQTESSRFWDAAVLITLRTSLLYVLGYAYWSAYYSYFGISREFFDLSLDQVVSTSTWSFGFIFLSFILILSADFEIFDKKFSEISFSLKQLQSLIIILPGLLIFLFYVNRYIG